MKKTKIVAVNKKTGANYVSCAKSKASPEFYRVSKKHSTGTFLVNRKNVRFVK